MRNPPPNAPRLRYRAVLPASIAAVLTLAACAPPAEPAKPPPAAPVAVAEPTAEAPPVATGEPAPVATAEPTPEPAALPPDPPAALPATARGDLADSPGDPRLDAGAAFLRAGQALKARLALTKAMPDLDKTASLDVRMAGHALLGRACHALADTKCTTAHYEEVRNAWKDPAVARKALDAAGGDAGAKAARLGRALNAAGEALFARAEEKRLAGEQERFPVYKGSGSRDDVLKHINTKVATWARARRALNEEAEKAYIAVLDLQPAPPPQWVVASASRVGTMWGKFTAEFRAAPIPAEWKQSGPHPLSPDITWEDIRTSYYAEIDSAAAPFVAQARGAFEKCQATAKKFAVQDEYSRACDIWLSKNPKTPSP